MSKAYKAVARKITTGKNQGKVMYNVRPVSYGLLTTDDVAKQISAESTATPGDVKAVLDRYAYFVVENLKKGYNIELLGFGTISLRFKNKPCVASKDEVSASLVDTIMPAFHPSFNVVNGKRIYKLVPEKITLVKYGSKNDDEA